MLVMQRLDFASGLSTPSEEGRKAYGNLFNGTVGNIKALDALFNDTRRGSCRQQRRGKASF